MITPTASDASAAIVRMQGINKWYGSFHALRDIDLHVASGERVVICGPSGSGKSTLVRTANLLEPFQQGRLQVCGIEVGANEITRAARLAIRSLLSLHTVVLARQAPNDHGKRMYSTGRRVGRCGASP